MNGWIDVRERLPEDKQMVLGHYGGSWPFTVLRFEVPHPDYRTNQYWTDGYTGVRPPLHWQPLPPPPGTSNNREYQEETLCGNCHHETPHTVYDSGHERDSSHDWRRCNVCGWKARGMSGKYEPHIEA